MFEDVKLLELSEFDGLLGETFVFSLEGVEEKALGVLIKAEHIQSGTHPGVDRKPFRLDFKFPAGANIGQCVFNAETANGQEFPPIFLIPYKEDEDGWYMNAFFN